MNYIYDILLNFKNEFIDFFEWNSNDEIIHIRKIPVFKVEKKKFCDFKSKNLKIDLEFLDKITNKTEIFKCRNKKTIKYSFLIGDNDSVMAVLLSADGKIIGKSDLLIDEHEDTVEVINQLEIEDIKYEIVNAIKLDFRTRNEKDKINYILDKLYKTEDDKLKYLYYECFNIKEKNIDKIKKIVEKEVNNNMKIVEKIYNFYKLLSYNAK